MGEIRGSKEVLIKEGQKKRNEWTKPGDRETGTLGGKEELLKDEPIQEERQEIKT